MNVERKDVIGCVSSSSRPPLWAKDMQMDERIASVGQGIPPPLICQSFCKRECLSLRRFYREQPPPPSWFGVLSLRPKFPPPQLPQHVPYLSLSLSSLCVAAIGTDCPLKLTEEEGRSQIRQQKSKGLFQNISSTYIRHDTRKHFVLPLV